jgi:Kef-type K+ transport system membrane component KefB
LAAINPAFLMKKLLQITNIQLLILFFIGLVLTLAGAIMKLKGSPEASLFLIIGMTFEAVALLVLILKLLQKNPKSFLDS